jgi:hypothetical protein
MICEGLMATTDIDKKISNTLVNFYHMRREDLNTCNAGQVARL